MGLWPARDIRAGHDRHELAPHRREQRFGGAASAALIVRKSERRVAIHRCVPFPDAASGRALDR
ncbi:hypothetical protein ASF27_04645 [Methylobacterium sp. Leaf102]|nr:hypothetical protein ASF27_04645 [Methylobacterium sp. Leaf102]